MNIHIYIYIHRYTYIIYIYIYIHIRQTRTWPARRVGQTRLTTLCISQLGLAGHPTYYRLYYYID